MSRSGRQFGPVPKRWLGFYGCAEADRVVAVRSRPLVCVKPFYSWSYKLTCPACSQTHIVKPLWRETTEHEQRTRGECQVPEVYVDPEQRGRDRTHDVRTERRRELGLTW